MNSEAGEKMPEAIGVSARMQGVLDSCQMPAKKYFRIGEVATIVAVEPHALRYWETKCPQVRPGKGRSGHRQYRRKDVEALLLIRHLIDVEGYTLEGANRALRERSLSMTTKKRNAARAQKTNKNQTATEPLVATGAEAGLSGSGASGLGPSRPAENMDVVVRGLPPHQLEAAMGFQLARTAGDVAEVDIFVGTEPRSTEPRSTEPGSTEPGKSASAAMVNADGGSSAAASVVDAALLSSCLDDVDVEVRALLALVNS